MSITEREFSAFLTLENFDEVTTRIERIFGNQDVFWSLAKTQAGEKHPTLDAHLRTQRYAGQWVRVSTHEDRWAGFSVYGPGTITWGAGTTDASGQPQARATADAKRAYTHIHIIGGNEQEGLLGTGVEIRGLNEHGVSFHTIARVEDISTQERVEQEAHTLEQVAELLARRGVDSSVSDLLRAEAHGVRYSWTSVLG